MKQIILTVQEHEGFGYQLIPFKVSGMPLDTQKKYERLKNIQIQLSNEDEYITYKYYIDINACSHINIIDMTKFQTILPIIPTECTYRTVTDSVNCKKECPLFSFSDYPKGLKDFFGYYQYYQNDLFRDNHVYDEESVPGMQN